MENPYSVILHWQFTHDNGEFFEEILSEVFRGGKSLIVDLVPDLLSGYIKRNFFSESPILLSKNQTTVHSEENQYPDYAVDKMRDCKNSSEILFSQGGFRHWCEWCYDKQKKNVEEGKGKYPDIHHEHVCLDGKVQSLSEQKENIWIGREIIKKAIGATPSIYRPANHSWNKDTLTVAKDLGFTHFLSRSGFDYLAPGLISMPAYEDTGLIVVPETKTKGSAPLKMFYYDRDGKNKETRKQFFDYLEKSVSLSEIPVVGKPLMKTWASEKLVKGYKHLRDFRKHAGVINFRNHLKKAFEE